LVKPPSVHLSELRALANCDRRRGALHGQGCTLEVVGEPLEPDARFMYDRLQDKVAALEARVLAFAEAVRTKYGVQHFHAAHMASQERVRPATFPLGPKSPLAAVQVAMLERRRWQEGRLASATAHSPLPHPHLLSHLHNYPVSWSGRGATTPDVETVQRALTLRPAAAQRVRWCSPPLPPQVVVVGRIVCDAEGRLNERSVLLEGSIKHSAGHRVRLELRDVPSFSLFPGMVGAAGGGKE
jgi:hypothetical protein